jgi:ATP-dependent protease ClpP protease subunit
LTFDLLYRRDEAEHRKLQARARKARAADTDSLPIVITGELNRRMSDEIETLLRDRWTAAEVIVTIDSNGGNFVAAFDIFDALHRHPAERKVARINRAESGALLAALGCDIRIAHPSASLLLHPGRLTFDGELTAQTARKIADDLQWSDEQTAKIFAYRTGRPVEVFADEGLTETPTPLAWCLDMGVIHEVANG